MGRLSARLTSITFGLGANAPLIERLDIDQNTGVETNAGTGIGNSLKVRTPGSTACLRADRVWNAVWNDVADFQLLADKLEYGRCYMDTKDGAMICTKRCQMSVIGIASDTFGFGVGNGANPNREVPIAVAGWVLAFVDKEYECGTVLTNDEFGNLTAMTRDEKLEYPERIVALYKRKELDTFWGPEHSKIEVNGRHWVKVK
jgi:hypothetical protein